MADKHEAPDTYVIPPNFIETGTIFGGMFKLRNAIEAGLLAAAAGLPFLRLQASLTTKIILLCLTALPLDLIALIGVSGESLSSFIMNFFRFVKNRRVIKGSVPITARPAKKARQPKNEVDALKQQLREARRKQKPKQSVRPGKKRKATTADYLNIEKIENGVIYTRDHRYVKIIEVVPINFLLRSAREQRNIIYSFISFLKISPVKMQFKVLTKRADIGRHIQHAFYFSREMKSVGEEHLKIRSSRASGILLTENELLLVYNTGANLMKWEYQTELRCKVLMTTRFCQDAATMLYPGGQARALMLGADMEMALTLLNSTGGHKRQFFRLDGTFERFYFAPNTPEGETQVKILCSSEIREELRQLLLSDLQPPQPGLRVEHDALRDDGVPVLLAYEFDMEHLRRFRDSLQMFGDFGLVVCFDFQQAVLEEYLVGLAEFQAVSLEKVRRRFGI